MATPNPFETDPLDLMREALRMPKEKCEDCDGRGYWIASEPFFPQVDCKCATWQGLLSEEVARYCGIIE